MRAYLQRSIEAALRQLFPADDAETALSWWIASEGRSPVVVVGAGFTRNAVDRVSGRRIAPAHVPLWGDVLRRFEADLGGPLEGVDALTIAELHAQALGPRRHVDLLLEMLPDDRLLSGPAHEAIFDLRPAAIVTTNFLDTVLDRHPRALAIFDDTSAAARIDSRERTEVLYLHGHRSAPATWVLTRSQYDTLEHSRPVLLTRVRQLFAQHPILTVGFGLADPDFHQVQGQIHAQMAGYQPLGLTLLGPLDIADRSSRRESALRGHWEKRRLRIVRFKEGDFGANLTAFLRLPGKIELSVCEKLLRDERSFRKRVELARSVLLDPDVERRIDAEYGWQVRLWRTCLEADFTEAERRTIGDRWNEAVQASAPAPARPVSVTDPSTSGRPEHLRLSTQLLNDGPGFSTWELAWFCDGWLRSGRDKADLVDWLHERIVHRDWPMHGPEGDADIRIAELLILIVESLPADAKARHAAGDAVRLLRRYDPETCSRLTDRFNALRDDARSGPTDPLHDVDRQMTDGYRASMNGDHAGATAAYHRAFEAAQRATDPLALWFAARSRRYAHELQHADAFRQSNEERDRRARRHIAEEREAERHPKVVEWETEANDRVMKLRKLTVEDLHQQRQRRAFDSMHMRLSDVPHLAWRTMRDLEEAGAHPIVQRHYLLPLLDHGFGEIATETRYRLTFDVDRFRAWSRLAIEDGTSHDRAAYDERSAAFVSAWHSLATNVPSVSAVVGCIKGVESLLAFVRNDDVDKVRDVLVAAPRILGAGVPEPSFGPGAVKTFSGTVDTGSALMRAWVAWLGVRGRPADFAAFKAWADTVRSRDLFDVRDGVHRVRWEALIRAGVPSDDLIAWLCTSERLDWLKKANRARFGQPFAVTLWRIAAAQPKGLSLTGWRTIALALSALLPETAAAMMGEYGLVEGDDLVRAGFGVLAAWDEGGQVRGLPAALRALRTRLERLASSFLRLTTTTSHAAPLTLAQLSVAAEIVRFGRAVAAAEIEALAARLDADWFKVVAFCKNNRGEIRNAVDFLAAVVETTSGDLSAGAQAKILELLAVSSSGLDRLSRILDRERWTPSTWGQFVQLLRDAANGARGRFPGSARVDLCELVRHAVLSARSPLPSELQFLARYVMDLSAHEETTVANHAAYALVSIAKWGIAATDSALAQEAAQTIRALATEARPSVRSAAAYALGFVGRSSHDVMRELATALSSLADDPYAQVYSEWWQGQRRIEEQPRRTPGNRAHRAPKKRAAKRTRNRSSGA
jgi:hypothetical protein